MSDTPTTDAAEQFTDLDVAVVDADFARDLEHRLRDIHGRVSWRQCSDNDGLHHIPTETIRAIERLSDLRSPYPSVIPRTEETRRAEKSTGERVEAPPITYHITSHLTTLDEGGEPLDTMLIAGSDALRVVRAEDHDRIIATMRARHAALQARIVSLESGWRRPYWR